MSLAIIQQLSEKAVELFWMKEFQGLFSVEVGSESPLLQIKLKAFAQLVAAQSKMPRCAESTTMPML